MQIPVIESTRTVWLTVTNSDLTEGRGHRVILGASDTPETAARLGRGRSVMGSDCIVERGLGIMISGRWYFEGGVHQENATDKELRIVRENKEQEAAKREAVLAKASMLGLSEEDLRVLRGS